MPTTSDYLDGCPLAVPEVEATLDDDLLGFMLFASIVEGLDHPLRLLIIRRLLARHEAGEL